MDSLSHVWEILSSRLDLVLVACIYAACEIAFAIKQYDTSRGKTLLTLAVSAAVSLLWIVIYKDYTADGMVKILFSFLASVAFHEFIGKYIIRVFFTDRIAGMLKNIKGGSGEGDTDQQPQNHDNNPPAEERG